MSQHGRIARAKAGQAARISAEREALQARLAVLDRGSALRDRGEIDGDNTPTSDTLDTVQETMAKEEALAVREALIQRLKVLARAEEKIREGTYGICEACGAPIPAARLRALPEAILCVSCAEAEERPPVAKQVGKERGAKPVWRTIRTVTGLTFIGLGLIGMVIPVIPGIPLLIAGVSLVGANHPWVRPVMARFRAWRRKWKRSR